MSRAKAPDRFLPLMRQYFTVHLPHQRQRSEKTIASIRQTWNMLLRHVSERKGIRLERLTFDSVNQDAVQAFLSEMQESRGWSKATYNQRLSCIKSFFRYVAETEPLLAMHLQGLSAVHSLRMPKTRPVSHLSDNAVKALLSRPDPGTRTGMRDRFLMVLMFDSGARCGEILGMSLGDFNADGKSIQVMGKGQKPRLVPVTDETVGHFKRYAQSYHPDAKPETPLFYAVHGHERVPMSHDNVARFMNQYASAAHAVCPEVPERVHPHQLRHSRAMGLYRQGMPLPLIAEWLGHGNPETTLVYAYADVEMKREAIERASGNGGMSGASKAERVWEGSEDIIRRLCGLR